MLNALDPTLNVTKIRLIAYDLDGTLVDAFEDIWSGVNAALREHGLAELPYATVRSYVGDGARMLIRRCVGEAHQDRFEEVYQFYRRYYDAHPVDRALPYPGVLETLDRLRALGLRQAILTNKPDEVTHQICARLGIAARMDGIWGERPGSPRKPEAQSLLAVLDHFGVEPSQCLFVGDGPADIEVGRVTGTPVVAVSYGLLSRAQWQAMRPAAVIDALPELIELFAPVSAARTAREQ